MLGQPMIILNSYEAAVRLLESRSANTSDRPSVVMTDLTGYTWVFAVLGYTQAWRTRRRLFHTFFQRSAIPQYRPIHLRQCHRFLQRLLTTPDDFMSLARQLFSETIMAVVYGITIAEHDDPYVSLAEKATNIFGKITMPGQYLVESMPFLRHIPSWFPGAGFKRDALQWSEVVVAARDAPYDAAMDAFARGTAGPSVVTTLVENAMREHGSVSPQDDESFRDVAGLAYLTGADTSLFSTQAMFLAMVLYPDVQKKAQQELDAVIGPDRLPEFSDRDSLPYINAVVKEIIRWHTVVPLGISHCVTEEDEYGGYRIPAGTILVPNAWAMSRDPQAYPQPDEFIPERFMKVGECGSGVRDPEKYQFGFGRRICPGRHFANDALFITVASVLHVFNIEPPLGPDGKPAHVVPDINMDAFLSFPEKFECRIRLRSAQAEALIRRNARSEF
ncbi:O-methylsterigmatocystin oxidoreductase [Trametes pubescens]|uniref:O-methylsterigmatocystin oxidoreductase n=1 Tax=Trametes pubescens TaxID=154538 RepID=A0A1M2V5R4_TRAPU|nr:O-methylsterigmatocystin oxidoreductase [Trametes pubescens]